MSDSNSVMRCRPAGAGKQCAAAFVDCGFVLLCGVIAALLGHNIPVTFLVMLESVAVLAIGEGSRGLTPGNMMFGLRTVRVEGMRDVTAGTLPAGMGRILVKYCVLIGSTLALVIGLIAVICSPLFAKDDLHQGWADRLASLGCVDIHQRVEALEEQPVVSRQIPPVPMPRMQPTPPVPLPKQWRTCPNRFPCQRQNRFLLYTCLRESRCIRFGQRLNNRRPRCQ